MAPATTSDGVALALRRHRAAAPRRAVALCTHAMWANGRYLERGFAQWLATRGVDAYVLDWRGHGQSVPPSPRDDRWCFDDYVRRDLPAAIDAVCADAGCAPSELIYLGHSLGGLVGLAGFAIGAAPRPAHVIACATSVWLEGPRGSLRRRAFARAFELSARPLGYAPLRALGLGSDDEPHSYVRQFASWARTGRWTGADGTDYLAALRALDVPVSGIAGAGDRLCPPADARALLERLPGAASLRVVGRAHGDAIDADHFSLFSLPALAPAWNERIGRAAAML